MICIFCFYNVSSGVQAKLAFSKEFRHCHVITFDGQVWLVHEFDLYGIHSRKIQVFSSSALLKGMKQIDSLIAMVAVQVGDRTQFRWKPYLVRSCNELDRYISGVDVGFTFNPKHLYNKLLKHNGTNYEILYQWRRENGIF